MIHDDLYATGLEQRRRMFGPAGAEGQVEHTTDLNDKVQDFVTRVCFGDIWQRDGLSVADRSKITIAMLIAQGKSHEIRVHMRGALANGISPLELREIVVHSILYIGIPGAVEGLRALDEVLAENGISQDLDGESGRTATDTGA
ncbi:4-carboxymuconolactone decarboxylase [Pseudoclavibacter endophyticus]|uniref:4-carboxymuconolactone decarboxylase n=1 Tax=Pseudoclavibacter endophyticus TaxID=1778590 RepID=A0A6H9WRD8_9MICO|nr:carboxymuconolactone decarboxylase family protein [Pseudoclavibacter endophyticus]KAB1649517.1 4-carboxymuconolactone decarboxylase [Pseudoclavibacter endophyticus]GGA61981.1 4-carboxymuconolactone decarboxylase [Pseudoclavibacter endophyticus]